jgi:hypothetical protein
MIRWSRRNPIFKGSSKAKALALTDVERRKRRRAGRPATYSERALKALPIVISVTALGLSFWTFYFREIRVKNGLILVPAEAKLPPVIGGLIAGAHQTQIFDHPILLVNDGNRPAAVLEVAFRLHKRPAKETPDLDRLCRPDPEANPPTPEPYEEVSFEDFKAESKALPAIVEPGKIVPLPLTYSLNSMEDLAGRLSVPVCLRVLALDSAGRRHDRVYPYTIIETYTRPNAPPLTVGSGTAGSADSGKIIPKQIRLIGP